MRTITSLLLLTSLLTFECQSLAAETIEEYTARRVAEITVPSPPHRLRGTAERTYVYWHTAAAQINICVDQQTIRKDHFWTAGKVGPLITRDLRTIPQEGVDPDAVDAVLQIADTFDDMRGIAHSMTESAAKLGIAFAGGPTGGMDDGRNVLNGPGKIAAMLRDRDAYDRKVVTALHHRYSVPFQGIILENVSPVAGTWFGYDGVCAGG